MVLKTGASQRIQFPLRLLKELQSLLKIAQLNVQTLMYVLNSRILLSVIGVTRTSAVTPVNSGKLSIQYQSATILRKKHAKLKVNTIPPLSKVRHPHA